jgi:hypothetical protein
LSAALPDEVAALARRLADEPAAVFVCELPQPPGINEWWEPVTIRRGTRSVASMRLSRGAERYKGMAEGLLLRQGADIVALEDAFRDLWLRLYVTSYLTTPMERDVDGPLKPMQDFICRLLGANDARVRVAAASVRLDQERPRVDIRVEGYRVWAAGDDGPPYYMLKTTDTAFGRRSAALEVTARRRPTAGPTLIIDIRRAGAASDHDCGR